MALCVGDEAARTLFWCLIAHLLPNRHPDILPALWPLELGQEGCSRAVQGVRLHTGAASPGAPAHSCLIQVCVSLAAAGSAIQGTVSGGFSAMIDVLDPSRLLPSHREHACPAVGKIGLWPTNKGKPGGGNGGRWLGWSECQHWYCQMKYRLPFCGNNWINQTFLPLSLSVLLSCFCHLTSAVKSFSCWQMRQLPSIFPLLCGKRCWLVDILRVSRSLCCRI